MDSLHLFTIPKWLPLHIPPEIWTIIFCWKWRLEMKDIHKTLIEKRRNSHKFYIYEVGREFARSNYKRILYKLAQRLGYNVSQYHVWSPSDELNMYTGDYWIKYDDYLSNDVVCWSIPQPKLVTVYNKCGIELLFPYSMNFAPDGYGHIKLYEHLKNNLNKDCSENTTFLEMKKLCQSI